MRAAAPCHRLDTLCTIDENSRPNENCVDRMSESRSSVRMTMIDPARLKYSARRPARNVPRYPPAPLANATCPTASESSASRQPISRIAPTIFV
jgi:hypothetical protein